MDSHKKVIVNILVFVWGLFSFVCLDLHWAYADDIAAKLAEARYKVDQKEYGAALSLYEDMGSWLRTDPGLLIEWARVHTYADHHRQAIALFEEARKKYPERESEILRELADQYKWDGQLAAAIQAYRKGMDNNPSDAAARAGLAQALAWNGQYAAALKEYDAILEKDSEQLDALLGKADVLSWQDKLETADSIFQQVLKKDPGNLTALNARARMKVWNGKHRAGIKSYKEILKTYPGNPDALEGIAYAYHWQGWEQQAVRSLEEILARYPRRDASVRLYDSIAASKQYHYDIYNRYTYDSNRLSIFDQSVHAGRNLDEDTVFGFKKSHQWYRQQGNTPVQADGYGVDGSHRFNEYWSAHTYGYVTRYDCNGFTPFTTNTWVTYQPDDAWRFDVSYDRETFDDINALKHGVVSNSGSISFDYKPDRFWIFSTKYRRSRYSDTNNQNTVFSRLEYRFWQKPYMKLYYNFYYSDWSERLDSGYFNPSAISAQTLGLYASQDLTNRLFLEKQVSIGYEKQNPKSNRPTYFGAVGLHYRLTPRWQIGLRGEYFNALDTNPKKGYSKKSAWLTATYKFGVDRQAHTARQPQRPAGQ